MCDIWLNKPSVLLSIPKIPREHSNFNDQLNEITKIIIIITAVMCIMNRPEALPFGLLSVIFVVFLYYVQRKRMPHTQEGFISKDFRPTQSAWCKRMTDSMSHIRCNATSSDQAKDLHKWGKNPSLNHRTSKPAFYDKRVDIPPVLAPRSHDITVWGDNPNITHSAINSNRPHEKFLSGYSVKNPPLPTGSCSVRLSDDSYEGFQTFGKKSCSTTGCPAAECPTGCDGCGQPNRDYEILQPGVYTDTSAEPAHANIGITQTYQIPEVEAEMLGDIKIYRETESQPKPPSSYSGYQPIGYNEEPRHDNVYDPRFTGYSDNRRMYICPVTGRPRWNYGDLDRIRQNRDIFRSKIDHLDARGDSARLAAEQDWLDKSLEFRDSLTQSRMNKLNAIHYQRKQYPISRN